MHNRSTSDSGARHPERPSRQNITPPKRHPLGLIGGLFDESRRPADPSKEGEEGKEEDAVAVEGHPGLCNSAGSHDSGDAVVANDSSGGGGVHTEGMTRQDYEESSPRLVGSDGGGNGGFFNRQTKLGGSSFGASRGGGGSGGGNASLFDMVMSGASCSSQPSFDGGGGGDTGSGVGSGIENSGGGSSSVFGSARERNTGTNRLATAGARAEGGKPIVASSLSGILGGMRGGPQQPAHAPGAGSSGSMATDNGGLAVGRGASGGLDEDWMAMNLEKLSNFRVPETRMGFPEGAREVLVLDAERRHNFFQGWEGKGEASLIESQRTKRV